jgi:hypothetical protein
VENVAAISLGDTPRGPDGWRSCLETKVA